MKRARFFFCSFILAAVGLGFVALPAAQEARPQAGLQVRFSFTEAVSKAPLDGRIIIGFHKDTTKPINNPDLFDPQPTFAWDVRDWKPGESIVLDGSRAVSWKGGLDSLDGWYGVQAVFKNPKARSVEAKGNAATARNVVYIEKGKMCRPLDFLFNRLSPGRKPFKETEFIKEVNFPSELLTRFFGEPASIQAAVILPPSYFKESARLYPSVYVLGGWGASPYDLLAPEAYQQKRYGTSGFGEEKVFIFLDLECRSGYHVFCDSEIEGPREQTFFKELVPFIEKSYRVDKDPRTRFLMGQSTGGWASLWLLVSRPDQFGGAYAGSTDPADFTEFTGTNIYEKGANMYFDALGKTKYFGFKEPLSSLSIQDFVGLDRIAGWGEQMYSFDATFSPKDGNGRPRPLFDWDTGKVDPEVASAWARYDLSKVVAGLDKAKRVLLQNKIHVFVEEDDPFGLNRPAKGFQKALAKRGISADIRFLPGDSHSTWNDEIRKVCHEDMDAKCREAGSAKAS